MFCRRVLSAIVFAFVLAGCDGAPAQVARSVPAGPIPDSEFVRLIARISEPDGYFDTDNLISNEGGFLTVIDALREQRLGGGAYIGVGPDQNYSYIAELRPEIAFITDVRRDNQLQHLLLKALIERAPTRVEFLAGLHGVEPPENPEAWAGRTIEDVVAYIDEQRPDPGSVQTLFAEIRSTVQSFGLGLSEDDLETIRRFHAAFVSAGLGLRFTSYGRPPRRYYPTSRQLVLASDIDGDAASYLATAERYRVVRDLHSANRIVPVVGDMSGPTALREIGSVLSEMGVELTAFYTSNVEFYLWQGRSFDRWRDNLNHIPVAADALVIRSYFPNSGARHPSAVQGYYSTQTLQRISTLVGADFSSYWDAVTRDVLDLRVGVRGGR